MPSSKTARVKGISLYPIQWAIVENHGKTLRRSGKHLRSAAIQDIIMDWAQLRGVTPPPPAIVNLSDGALEAYPPQNPPVTILRDPPSLIDLIEESDLTDTSQDPDPETDLPPP